MTRLATTLLFIFAIPLITRGAQFLLTFDLPASEGGQILLSFHKEAGMVFSGDFGDSFSQSAGGLEGFPNNGSSHLEIGRFQTGFQFQIVARSNSINWMLRNIRPEIRCRRR